ncbi:sulfurtransferase [Blastochloris sulfoviridis]|nr:rhodanese-like domain-containing protein [Blastochloris sulfoviridis]
MTSSLPNAASATPSMTSGLAGIVDAAGVAAAMARDAIVWDVRDGASFAQGHIPGAVHVPGGERLLRLPTPEEGGELAWVANSLGEAGLDLDREIIAYGTRGSPFAYAGAFALRYFGARRVATFHDGIEGWREAGEAIETTGSRRQPVTVELRLDPALVISTREVLARLGAPDMVLLDVRTPGEFAGTDVRAARGGRIPGAINIPFEANWRDPETAVKLARGLVADSTGMRLKPLDELRDLYASLDPAKEIVVYCQSGVRATETASVLAELGFGRVRLYKRSWVEYALQPEAPVATGEA